MMAQRLLVVLCLLCGIEASVAACTRIAIFPPNRWEDRLIGADFIVKAVVRSVAYFNSFSWRAVVEVKENLRGQIGKKKLSLEFRSKNYCRQSAQLSAGQSFILLLSRQSRKNGVYNVEKFDVYRYSDKLHRRIFSFQRKRVERFKWRKSKSGLQVVSYNTNCIASFDYDCKVASHIGLGVELVVKNTSNRTLRIGFGDYRPGRATVWVGLRIEEIKSRRRIQGRLLNKKLRAYRARKKRGTRPMLLKPGEWKIVSVPVIGCQNPLDWSDALAVQGFLCYPHLKAGKYKIVATLENFPGRGKSLSLNAVTLQLLR